MCGHTAPRYRERQLLPKFPSSFPKQRFQFFRGFGDGFLGI